MVFRSLSEDDVHIFRDLPIARSTESHRSIGCEGGILHLDSCDVTMSIPPRTVQAGTCHDVSIVLVTDDPPPIRESEFLTGLCIGITFPAQWRCSTNQPITLNLPHAATLLKSNDVHASIIWKRTESTSVNRHQSLEDSHAQCIIKEREINLIIDATSVIRDKVQLWIPIKLHVHALGKRMACTPFLPVDMAHGQDITLRIYIHEDIPYIVQKIQEEEENFLYRQVHPGRCFALEPESSDLELECNGRKEIISATELFNRQKTLVSMPITTDTDARMQMINISITATSTNQPKASMAFMAIRTGFSTDIHSTLNAMVPGSNTDLSNAEEVPSLDFITKEMNTDQYYHLGLALGMSHQTLDTIQFRSRQYEESRVYTPNQKAAIFMIRYWKCLHHSVSIADDNLKEVWKSVSDSGHSIPASEGQRAGRGSHENAEDFFEEEFHLEESRTASTVGLHACEEEILEARGHWAESLHRKRSKTPSVRSDSLNSFSTLLEEEEESRSPKRYGANITGSVRAHRRTFSTARRIRGRVQRVLSIDEHHKDEEKERSKQAIFAWMESGKGVTPAGFRPHEDTSKPTDDEGQKIEPVHHMPSPSALQDDIPVQNLESRDDLSEVSDVIRLEKYGIEVRIPPNEAYSAMDVTVEPIHDIPTELVLKEMEAIISIGLRMSPSNATFDIPVTVTMPHCGIFTKPEDAKVVTYYRKTASESFTAIPSSNGSPRCVVRHRDLDIYMNHFSEFWIVAFITRVFIGKRVICTPYIPVSTPKNYEHVLFVHVIDEHIGKVKVQPGYMAPITGEQFLVRWGSGGLKITCPESTMKDEAETLQGSEIRHLNEHKVMFKVDTRTADKNRMILEFILKQSTTKRLLVPMNLQEITDKSLRDTVSASVESSAPTSADIPPQDAPAADREISAPRSSDTVSDGELNILADQVPHDKYYHLSDRLGIGYNKASTILSMHSGNYQQATRECLSIWKNKTGGSFTKLKRFFDSVHLGGMFTVPRYEEDPGPDPNQSQVCNLISLMFIVAFVIAIFAIVAIRD